jgi:cobalt-zinc-cadmium efflux system protein
LGDSDNENIKKGDVQKSLEIGIILTTIFFVVEVIGGYISGSLSLLGDAGHMFRDIFSLFASLGAVKISQRVPTKTKTFGYHRVEIFAALINGFLLIGVSGWIFWEAYHRFISPQPIQGETMFLVALLGLIVNVYVTFRLHGSHDLNVRSAFLHVLTDTISSIAIILASIWIFFTGQIIVDPVLSVLIAFLILFSAFPIIKDSFRILLEFTPKGVKLYDVIGEIENTSGVYEVHHVHLWSICSNVNALTAHILTSEQDMAKIENIKNEIKEKLEKYYIKHVTLEFECEKCVENAEYLCPAK